MELYYLFNTRKLMYFYYDENNFPSMTYDPQKADYFEHEKACNILNNSISPAERKHWLLMKYTVRNAAPDTAVNELDEIESDSEILKELIIISRAADRLIRYISELDEKLSEIDKQQCDVLHFIEKYDLNACDGFKAYKLLKEIRMERRVIKNEIRKAQLLNKEDLRKMDLSNLAVKMSEQDKHTDYTPRILTELFDLRETGTNFDISRRDIKTGT